MRRSLYLTAVGDGRQVISLCLPKGNSYRGNGGGELLTKGAGIPQDSLKNRVIWRSELDQRYYLMQEIEKAKIMDPKPLNNWKFIPEKWVKAAAKRDKKILFGE